MYDSVVKSVLSRNGHLVDGVTLGVSAHHPPQPIPMDPYKAFIEGVNSNTTHDCLMMYIERCCGQEPVRAVQGQKPGTFMLLFGDTVGEWHK